MYGVFPTVGGRADGLAEAVFLSESCALAYQQLLTLTAGRPEQWLVLPCDEQGAVLKP